MGCLYVWSLSDDETHYLIFKRRTDPSSRVTFQGSDFMAQSVNKAIAVKPQVTIQTFWIAVSLGFRYILWAVLTRRTIADSETAEIVSVLVDIAVLLGHGIVIKRWDCAPAIPTWIPWGSSGPLRGFCRFEIHFFNVVLYSPWGIMEFGWTGLQLCVWMRFWMRFFRETEGHCLFHTAFWYLEFLKGFRNFARSVSLRYRKKSEAWRHDLGVSLKACSRSTNHKREMSYSCRLMIPAICLTAAFSFPSLPANDLFQWAACIRSMQEHFCYAWHNATFMTYDCNMDLASVVIEALQAFESSEREIPFPGFRSVFPVKEKLRPTAGYWACAHDIHSVVFLCYKVFWER